MIILNIEPEDYSAEGRRILRGLGELREIECDRAGLLRQVGDAHVVITRLAHRIDREVLASADQLRFIVTATTGLNHIDLKAAAARGVEVLSLRGEKDFLDGVTATAELTWGLLLTLVRRIPAAHEHVVQGGWNRDSFRGMQLKGKTLGLVGFGRLGRIVADYGRAFRMNVVASDPDGYETPGWVRRTSLQELLMCSDVVSLHVNLDDETHGFFDASAFSSMKHGALFLNTSRGELVDEVALLEALEAGRVAAAGLDVLAGETQNNGKWPQANVLWQYAQTNDNLVLTPHIGGNTWESRSDAEAYMARKLERKLCSRIGEST